VLKELSLYYKDGLGGSKIDVSKEPAFTLRGMGYSALEQGKHYGTSESLFLKYMQNFI